MCEFVRQEVAREPAHGADERVHVASAIQARQNTAEVADAKKTVVVGNGIRERARAEARAAGESGQ